MTNKKLKNYLFLLDNVKLKNGLVKKFRSPLISSKMNKVSIKIDILSINNVDRSNRNLTDLV